MHNKICIQSADSHLINLFITNSPSSSECVHLLTVPKATSTKNHNSRPKSSPEFAVTQFMKDCWMPHLISIIQMLHSEALSHISETPSIAMKSANRNKTFSQGQPKSYQMWTSRIMIKMDVFVNPACVEGIYANCMW